MDEQQLQTLRNLGNESEEAADEIVRLRAALAANTAAEKLERAHNAGFVEASRIHGREIEGLRAALAANVPAGLPENETPQMHDAAMAVLYAGVTRGTTNALWRAYRAALLAAAPAPEADDLQKQLDDALSSLDFYKRRSAALQSCQHMMRDPERTMVCDILANGSLLINGKGKLAAERYAPAQAQQSSEPPPTCPPMTADFKSGYEAWREAKPEAQQPLTNEAINDAALSRSGRPEFVAGFYSGARFAEATCAEAWGVKLAGIGASGEGQCK